MLFTKDQSLIAYTVHSLRIYMGTSLLFGIQLACQQTFIALGNAKSPLFWAVLRKIILLIPLIYILLVFMADKTTAVFLAEPIADLIAVVSTAALFNFQFRRSMKQHSQQ